MNALKGLHGKRFLNRDVFAVDSTDGNFAKVNVLSYGYNLGTKGATYDVES